MDFSPLDNSPTSDSSEASSPLYPCMVMDAVSRKWIGNEADFHHFDQIVSRLPVPELVPPEDSVFSVTSDTIREWADVAEEHNRYFANSTQEACLDIRLLAPLYLEARARSTN